LSGQRRGGRISRFSQLGRALGEFEELAADAVATRGGRLVKLIGDEAMFVVADRATACEIALDLTARLADHPRLPTARGALAAGDVLTRDGDYFGPVVNLAARAVKLAEPGRVLVSAEVRDATDGYVFAPVGARELRGFDEPVELFRLERVS
jgi:adenylate cyclase